MHMQGLSPLKKVWYQFWKESNSTGRRGTPAVIYCSICISSLLLCPFSAPLLCVLSSLPKVSGLTTPIELQFLELPQS
jgi:hypothetical protein